MISTCNCAFSSVFVYQAKDEVALSRPQAARAQRPTRILQAGSGWCTFYCVRRL